MRIGIVTLFHNNYNCGAVLQALALQKAIEKLGHTCCVIDYQEKALSLRSPSAGENRLVKNLKNLQCRGDFLDITGKISRDWLFPFQSQLNERKENYRAFINQYIPTTAPTNSLEISNLNSQFDAFVCGSDQIWRPQRFDPNYYLAFAEKEKTIISYGASFGVTKLNDNELSKIAPLIQRLNKISLREASLLPQIENRIDKPVAHVLDPTLLFNHEFWEKYQYPESLFTKDRYIFSYQIGESNRNRDVLKRLSHHQLPSVTIPGISFCHKYDFSYCDHNITNGAPNHFLRLIQDAKAVVTDSFHACVFSILFGTPFYALERFPSSDTNSMNDRIYNLLDIFNLNQNLLQTNTLPDCLPLPKIAPSFHKWDAMKEHSLKYLSDALKP